MRRISFGRACSYCCRSGGIRPMVRARGLPRFHPLCSKGGAQSSTRRRPPARELVVDRPGVDHDAKLGHVLQQQFQREGADATLGYGLPQGPGRYL